MEAHDATCVKKGCWVAHRLCSASEKQAGACFLSSEVLKYVTYVPVHG